MFHYLPVLLVNCIYCIVMYLLDWIVKKKKKKIRECANDERFCVSIVYIFKNIFKLNKEVGIDAATKKRANTSGVGKINNYCEVIYIPP